MVTLRKRARTLETPASNRKAEVKNTSEATEKNEISGYEQCRDERIKENLERMQKLGILDLSLKLKSQMLPPRPSPKSHSEKKVPQKIVNDLPPRRRSSRLQNATPVSYCEVRPKRNEKSLDDEDLIRQGSKPEIYTEEHNKLLGSCESSWTLFVDGFGPDGKRIYDQIKGKTCHQCRQKTLGHRTSCNQCNLVQGQFCGDCLYMRYGENVLEAKQNPNWVCPVCRDICNCSLCRIKKGWAPTGTLYKKISSLGFKSVAHYLIQTQRSTLTTEVPASDSQASAKRSLSFPDMVGTSQKNDGLDSGDGVDDCSNPVPEDTKDEDCNGLKESFSSDNCIVVSDCSSLVPEVNKDDKCIEENELVSSECLKVVPEDDKDDVCNKDNELQSSDKRPASNVVSVNSQKLKLQPEATKSIATPTPNSDSIADRLRKRPNKS